MRLLRGADYRVFSAELLTLGGIKARVVVPSSITAQTAAGPGENDSSSHVDSRLALRFEVLGQRDLAMGHSLQAEKGIARTLCRKA